MDACRLPSAKAAQKPAKNGQNMHFQHNSVLLVFTNAG
jgi:hypothetical protein